MPVTPEILAQLARAAGLPGWLSDTLGAVAPEAVRQLLMLARRYEAGEPLGDILRAQAPDPIGALQRVDAEDEGRGR